MKYRMVFACLLMAGTTAVAKDITQSFRSDVGTSAKPWTAEPRPSTSTIRFAVVGDRTGLARPGVFEQALVQVGWIQPEFIINVGDLLEGYSDDRGVLMEEWRHIEQAVDQVRIPFFYVAGNHDLGTDAQLTLWKERRGVPWYSFEYKGALFLVLDTEDPPVPMDAKMSAMFRKMAERMKSDPEGVEKTIAQSVSQENNRRNADTGKNLISSARFSDEQVQWAKRVLARHPKARWTFVLMHKPAWTLNSSQFEQIEQALGNRPYTMIAGHNHYYKHEKRRGRDYITMGTTGAVSHQNGVGNMDHIAWVTVGDDGPHIALVKLQGILNLDASNGQTRVR